ncbi:kelch domain-containing protein 8B isoform X3 [Empidonax traillii]|uniref:kelch domain-containing protein 8B isoform X3 n=1 Tax=Empidonax traillii TaxID=164674 RepID=UPI000FFD80A5|nr:kelch domain-containing protein 8B isoform X3 [Empidonax traillii]
MAAGAGAFAWATFPSMPTRRVYCSAAHRDGQLFVLGGCGGGGRALGTAEVLDLPAQRWTTLPPLPTPRAGAAALTLGKQILVVGGVDAAQSPLASVEVYHVDEGKWEKKAALAQPSMGISAVQRGGRQGKLPVTAFEAFDLETRSWTRYPSVPSRRAFAACAMADGVVFSLGGLQQPGPHNFYSRPHFVNTVEMFDPAQGAWRKPNRTIRMREKRADFVAGYLGGRVVAVGGLGNARACGPCFPLHPLWHISDLHDSGEVGCAKPQGYCNTVCIHIPFVPSKFQEDPTALSQRLPHWAPCLVHLQNTSGFFQLVCSVLGLHSPQWLNPTVQGCSCIPLLRELRKG